MSNKKGTAGIPKLGGRVMEIGRFVFRMVVVLSDHTDPELQELVVFEYEDKAKALKMRETILIEGISLHRKDEGVEIDMFYPARQIRKIIIRKEPLQTKLHKGDVVH